MNRRDCLKTLFAASSTLPSALSAAPGSIGKFRIKYALSTQLYGDLSLHELLPEFEHTGAAGINLWSQPHGTQREEVDKLGVEKVLEMLNENSARVIGTTCYPLGPFGLTSEIPVVKKLGGNYIITGSGSSKKKLLKGRDARQAVLRFIEQMLPHADAAGENGITIGIANLAGEIFEHPDAIRYFAEFNRHDAMGIALAPHQLRNNVFKLPELILELGNENLPYIYFQEDGDGAHHHLQKQIELEQMPGRGPLDYTMVARALDHIEFSGYAEIGMYTTPRGRRVFEEIEEITELFNESRIYIDSCVREVV